MSFPHLLGLSWNQSCSFRLDSFCWCTATFKSCHRFSDGFSSKVNPTFPLKPLSVTLAESWGSSSCWKLNLRPSVTSGEVSLLLITTSTAWCCRHRATLWGRCSWGDGKFVADTCSSTVFLRFGESPSCFLVSFLSAVASFWPLLRKAQLCGVHSWSWSNGHTAVSSVELFAWVLVELFAWVLVDDPLWAGVLWCLIHSHCNDGFNGVGFPKCFSTALTVSSLVLAVPPDWPALTVSSLVLAAPPDWLCCRHSGTFQIRCLYTEIMWHLDCTQVDFISFCDF